MFGAWYSHSASSSVSLVNESIFRTLGILLVHLFFKKQLVEDAYRVVGALHGMADSARICVDLVVVAPLSYYQQYPIFVPREHTLYVLSPKKWISSNSSSSTWFKANVLSHPLGNTSNEIWPPMEYVKP